MYVAWTFIKMGIMTPLSHLTIDFEQSCNTNRGALILHFDSWGVGQTTPAWEKKRKKKNSCL